MLAFRWSLGVDGEGVPAVELLIPLAGRRSLRLFLTRRVAHRPFWLRQGPVTLHYGLDAEGGDPFGDPDLRRFLLALGARFRAGMSRFDDAAAEALLSEAGL
jgi:hypothetical protein